VLSRKNSGLRMKSKAIMRGGGTGPSVTKVGAPLHSIPIPLCYKNDDYSSMKSAASSSFDRVYVRPVTTERCTITKERQRIEDMKQQQLGTTIYVVNAVCYEKFLCCLLYCWYVDVCCKQSIGKLPRHQRPLI
jgi:hypothetical protein